MHLSTLPLLASLLAGPTVPSNTEDPFQGLKSGYEVATGSQVIVDSHLSLVEATSGNHCEGDARFASVKARQRIVQVLYWGMAKEGVPDGKLHQGQIVVDLARVADVQALFHTAYRARLPIYSVIPVSKFGWHDAASMKANNTSGWNYRAVGSSKSCPSGTSGSKHASLTPGTIAIDINTVQNPYCHSDGTCEPSGARWDPNKPGTLTRSHPVIKMATAARGSSVTLSLCPENAYTWECSTEPTQVTGLGWSWGGNWNAPDYQHLEAKSN